MSPWINTFAGPRAASDSEAKLSYTAGNLDARATDEGRTKQEIQNFVGLAAAIQWSCMPRVQRGRRISWPVRLLRTATCSESACQFPRVLPRSDSRVYQLGVELGAARTAC